MHTTVTTTHPIRRTVAASALVISSLAAFAACGASTPAVKAKTKTTTTSTVATPTTSQTGSAGGSDAGGSNAGGNSGGGSAGTSGNNGTPAGGTSGGGSGVSSNTTAPTIQSFTTPENIDCHNGNLQTFTASWATQGATKVTISIDGPGIYDTYGPNGSTSLPFNCSSSHTFLLTAYSADGKTATKSVTLQPRNVQPATTTSEP
jgi:hypothetical protein